ncbi:DNA-binding response regulator [Georgfuchsia toluolica]|uniref:DNA-binding response regulator n=1 Tax=Georgfuchsia toluolica TaxID=424218 RepID=A0A916J4A6_9PROT|nr:response regulator transcription factor [Georgfuchsia toluolica]CAG4882212.1 DNA-binding response regulator [Georgfuchsia toluolica]
MSKIKILLVDDHAILRQGLRQILLDSEDMEVAGEAENSAQAIRLAREHQFDVVVLDITLPDRNGIETLKLLRRDQPKLAVLILTMHSEKEFGVRALKAGASGYLTKHSAAEQLVNAVRTVAKGKKYIGAALAEELANSFGTESDQPLHETLSDREYQVLCMIASGTALSEMAAKLSLSPKTVSVYRARVMAKMKFRNNTEITHYAIKHQLVHCASTP